MRVLKFTETDEAKAAMFREKILEQLNEWSRLRYLASDPEYTTQPFDVAVWNQHTTIPGMWWLDYDMLHANLGDSGRVIADGLIGEVGNPGLSADLPNCDLSLVNVNDLVSEGYLPDKTVLP